MGTALTDIEAKSELAIGVDDPDVTNPDAFCFVFRRKCRWFWAPERVPKLLFQQNTSIRARRTFVPDLSSL
jgi:hypothetical protein